jgi:hypothetical protein
MGFGFSLAKIPRVEISKKGRKNCMGYSETPNERNFIMKKIDILKKFVSDHKVALGVMATATAMFLIHRAAVKEWNAFLTEHNLLDEYYALTDE